MARSSCWWRSESAFPGNCRRNRPRRFVTFLARRESAPLVELAAAHGRQPLYFLLEPGWKARMLAHDHDDAFPGGPPIQCDRSRPSLLEWLPDGQIAEKVVRCYVLPGGRAWDIEREEPLRPCTKGGGFLRTAPAKALTEYRKLETKAPGRRRRFPQNSTPFRHPPTCGCPCPRN